MNDIYEVNKYGAINMKHILKMNDTIQEIVKEIEGIREEIDRQNGWFDYVARGYRGIPYPTFYVSVKDRLKKLEDLTKANDYEYKTTTETKLVKKAKK